MSIKAPRPAHYKGRGLRKITTVLLNESSNELLLYVIPFGDTTKQFLFMRFEKSETATAIYWAVKKASSLRYDYGHNSVKVEINGLGSTEMSFVAVTKFYFK